MITRRNTTIKMNFKIESNFKQIVLKLIILLLLIKYFLNQLYF